MLVHFNHRQRKVGWEALSDVHGYPGPSMSELLCGQIGSVHFPNDVDENISVKTQVRRDRYRSGGASQSLWGRAFGTHCRSELPQPFRSTWHRSKTPFWNRHASALRGHPSNTRTHTHRENQNRDPIINCIAWRTRKGTVSRRCSPSALQCSEGTLSVTKECPFFGRRWRWWWCLWRREGNTE